MQRDRPRSPNRSAPVQLQGAGVDVPGPPGVPVLRSPHRHRPSWPLERQALRFRPGGPAAARVGALRVLGLGHQRRRYRNIEANGVDELWDGRKRFSEVTARIVTSGAAVAILADYEHSHRKTAEVLLPRMMHGYDFTEEARQRLAESGVIVAFTLPD